MQYRSFGRLDWKVSALGFGAMRLPQTDNDPAHINRAEAIRMIRYAIDHGVNYVDTAYPYHAGQSERVVGEALQDGYRRKVKLATKLPAFFIESAGDFDRIFAEQLERLKTGKIDFYLLHGLNRQLWHKIRGMGVIKWAEGKMGKGLIGHLGFSFHDEYPAFREIVDAYDNWTFCQVMYNYADVKHQAGRRGVKYAAGKGLAVVVMEPIRGGLLSKKPPEAVARIWEGAPRQRSLAEWALMWVWNQPEISVALSGMSAMEQVIENVATADKSGVGKLTAGEVALLDRVRKAYESLSPIPCTNCKYCQPCPNGVEIPTIFEIYNDAMIYDVPEMGRMRYNGPFLKENQRADSCKDCKKCIEVCPQKINVPEWMKKVHAYLSAKP